MDIEESGDVIYDKVMKTISNSNNITHKKAIILIKGIKDSKIGTVGYEGIINYVKSIFRLLERANEQQNLNVLVFVLAVCLKQLNLSCLTKIQDKVLFILEIIFKSKDVELIKYGFIILEHILIINNNNNVSMNNFDNPLVKLYLNYIIPLIQIKNEELQRTLLKNFNKILKSSTYQCNMTILPKLSNYFDNKLQGILNFETNKNIDEERQMEEDTEEEHYQRQDALNTFNFGNNKQQVYYYKDSEHILKFLYNLIQFLPVNIVITLLNTIKQIVETTENTALLLNCFLIIEISFKTKHFDSVLFCDQMLHCLFNCNNNNNSISNSNSNNKEKEELKENYLISYIVSIQNVIISISKISDNNSNGNAVLLYCYNIISKFVEYFSIENKNEYLKNTIYNTLSNIITNTIKHQINNNNSINNNKNNRNVEEEEVMIIENININSSNNNNDHVDDVTTVIVKIVNTFLLLLENDEMYDNKYVYNLFLCLIEEVVSKNESVVNKVLEMLFNKFDKLEKQELFRIFVGKCFNYVKSNVITKYFNLQLTDYDITEDNYTEKSKVWIISYCDQFLKSNNSLQTLINYNLSFDVSIKQIKTKIKKLKQQQQSSSSINNSNSNVLLIIQRYNLILFQLNCLILKFLNFDNNNIQIILPVILQQMKKYVVAIQQQEEGEEEQQQGNNTIKQLIYKVISKIITHSETITSVDMKSIFNGDENIQMIIDVCFNDILSEHDVSKNSNLYNIAIFSKIINNIESKIIELISRFCLQSNSLPVKNESDLFCFDNNSGNNYNLSGSKTRKYYNWQINKNDLNGLKMILEVMNVYLQQTQQVSDQLVVLLNNFCNTILNIENSLQVGDINIKKNVLEVFITLLQKILENNKKQYFFNYFNLFLECTDLQQFQSKQIVKLFEIIINNTNTNNNLYDKMFNYIFYLTKDNNRKVRNMCYELIGTITDFYVLNNSNSNGEQLLNEWIIKMSKLLVSDNIHLQSAGINSLSRLVWQFKNYKSSSGSSFAFDFNNAKQKAIINKIADAVFLLMKNTKSKEIIKSAFLFVRVLLFVTENTNEEVLLKIKDSIFYNDDTLSTAGNSSNNNINNNNNSNNNLSTSNEFKVKVRNLIKNLILKYGVEKVKMKVVNSNNNNKSIENLINYVNKYIVKKMKSKQEQENEEYNYYCNGKVLDNSVMCDNDNNMDLNGEEEDEEEQFIDAEFKKIEKHKKNKLDKILENISNFNLNEQSATNNKNRFGNKRSEETNSKEKENIDKIEQLFSKDKVNKL